MPSAKTMLQLDQLHEDPDNVRDHDAKNLAAIGHSLAEYGQVEPLVVQASSNMVIGGNGRLRVMRDLGWQKAWCNPLDIDDAQARRLSLVLNRSAELAHWKEAELVDLLAQLEAAGDDVESLGWQEEDVASLMQRLQKVDDGADSDDQDPFAGKNDDVSTDVSFKFGAYSGLVSRPIYDAFAIAYRERQQATGEVMLDDVLRGWLGV